jgi:murein L,D-transpeptidase YcbB/YkuD
VILRLLSILVLAVAISGCASTQTKTQNERMETRITDLEKNIQSKDAEIVDLQYQVKDLSSKLESVKPGEAEQVSQEVVGKGESVKMSESSDRGQIIRVKASPEKIQRALKSAGVYTGPVDGKIGAGTKEAIIEFQKSHGLKADGVLGRKTWEELKKYLK